MVDAQNFRAVESERTFLEDKLNHIISTIGDIPVANKTIMPYGWRKAKKGRTVWRIVEEIISQGLESQANRLGFDNIAPAESEVGVYDFKFQYDGNKTSYVNIKSSVQGGKNQKDDISKAERLIDFYNQEPNANLYIATFVISFKPDMTIGLEKCIVFPIAWIPDVYVNPSNNGNLQSSKYKDIGNAIKRTPYEFLSVLKKANDDAITKRKSKNKRE